MPETNPHCMSEIGEPLSWSEAEYELQLQDSLGLSQEQWELPGGGDQLLEALRRAECQQGGVQ